MNQDLINKFKLRIESENKNNHTSRRRFSKKLKQDLVQFSNEYQISSYALADRIGISYTAIDNWKRKTISTFKKIEISKPTKHKKVKKIKNIDYHSAIKTNRYVLITLACLLLVDRIFHYLIDKY